MKENGMGGACSVHEKNIYRTSVGETERKIPLLR
jgi:hypothetical protein